MCWLVEKDWTLFESARPIYKVFPSSPFIFWSLFSFYISLLKQLIWYAEGIFYLPFLGFVIWFSLLKHLVWFYFFSLLSIWFDVKDFFFSLDYMVDDDMTNSLYLAWCWKVGIQYMKLYVRTSAPSLYDKNKDDTTFVLWKFL